MKTTVYTFLLCASLMLFSLHTANASMDEKHTRDSLARTQQQQQALLERARRNESSQTPQFSQQKILQEKESLRPLSSAQVAQLYEIQNGALAGFFKALDKIGKALTTKEAYLYLQEVPTALQKIHMNALERARFEIDWFIPHKLRLTNNDLYDYIRLKGHFPASVWSMSAASSFPWNSRAYDGLETLEKLKPKSFQSLKDLKSIPILEDTDGNLYKDPRIVAWFNEYTAQQLLSVVQRAIDQLFDKSTIASSYRLDQLLKQSKTDDEALKKLYILAFLNPEDRVAMLEHFMYTGIDWGLGIAYLFRQSAGSIQRKLPLKQAAELYLKVRFLPETRKSLQAVFPDMSQQSIDAWLDTYLVDDKYATANDIQRAIQEQEHDEAQEAEVSSLFEQFFARTSALIRPLFFWT